MWKLIIREIATRKTRFAAAVVAVMLGVAFLSLTLGVKNLAMNSLAQAETATLNADLYAAGPPVKHANPLDLAARGPINVSQAEVIEAVEGTAHAAPIFEGEAVLLDAHKRPLTWGFSATRVRGAYAFPPGPTLKEGRLPSGKTEVMLEESTAQRAGLKVGSQATLIWGGTVHRMQIVGIASFDAPLGIATMAFVDAKLAKTWFSPESRVKLIGIKASASANLQVVKERIQEAVGPDATIVEGAKLRAEHAAAAERAVGFVNTLVLWFVALALLAGGFLIANTFGIMVTSRYRALGLLRAVGYGAPALRRLVLGQALIVGVLGSVLGVALGGGLTAGLRAVLAGRGWLVDSWFSVSSLVAVIFAFLAGVVTTVLAGVAPAWRAGRIPPLSALELGAPTGEKPVRIRALVGAGLLAVAAGGTGLGLWLSGQTWDWTVLLVLAVSGIVGLVGLLAILAWLLGRMAAILALMARGLNLLPVRLALQNLGRYPRRATLGCAALVIGVAIATAGGVLADSARVSLRVGTVHEVQTDLVVASLQPSTSLEKVVRLVQDVPGVSEAKAGVIGAPVWLRLGGGATDDTSGSGDMAAGVSGVGVSVGLAATGSGGVAGAETVAGDSGGLGIHEVPALGISPADLHTTLRLHADAGSVASLEQGDALVNTRTARIGGWKLGDSITITGPLGIYSTKIGGFVTSSLIRADVFLDAQYLRQISAPEQVTRQFIFVNVVGDVTGVKQRIQKVLDPYYVFTVMAPRELAAVTAAPTANIVLVMHALLGFSVVIALLGVVNTLILAGLERRVTYRLLRVIGMKPREVGAMVRWEAFFLALLGALIGWGTGMVLGLTWRFALRHEGLALVSVPWLAQGGLIVVAVILAVVAAILPARQSARRSVMDT